MQAPPLLAHSCDPPGQDSPSSCRRYRTDVLPAASTFVTKRRLERRGAAALAGSTAPSLSHWRSAGSHPPGAPLEALGKPLCARSPRGRRHPRRAGTRVAASSRPKVAPPAIRPNQRSWWRHVRGGGVFTSSHTAAVRAAAHVSKRPVTTLAAGHCPSASRASASAPRRRAWVRDQS